MTERVNLQNTGLIGGQFSVMSRERAERTAAHLNADDLADCSYAVEVFNEEKDWYVIAVTDNDGHRLGLL
jgi:hypothetical protein